LTKFPDENRGIFAFLFGCGKNKKPVDGPINHENGITNGTGGSYFTGSRVITREEFVTLLYRYTAYRGYERDTSRDISPYSDSADVSDFAADAMKWAVGCGLITGKPGGLLAPKDTITRAEVALIMYRYNDVVPHLDEAIR
jgi:hypothetical protein